MGWVLTANALPELPVFWYFGSILSVCGMETLLLLSTLGLGLRLLGYPVSDASRHVAGGLRGVHGMDCMPEPSFSVQYCPLCPTFQLLPLVGLWAVIPLETLHALTFAAGWSACAINASKISPPGLEATMQAMFQSLWTGLGAGLGGLLGEEFSG
jgi:hypothetical protein